MPRTRKTTQRSQPTPLEDIFTDSSTEDVSFGEPEESPVHNGTPAGPTALDRILNAFAEGANKRIRRSGPIGLTPEDVADLRRRGIFNSKRGDPRLPHAVNQMLVGSRMLNEAIIPPAATLFDVGQLAIEAGLHGARDGGSQALKEAGLSFLNPDLLVRDGLGFIEQYLRRFR